MTTKPVPTPKRPSCLAYLMTTFITLSLIFVVMEIFLQATDPWGMQLFEDVNQMREEFIADPVRGFVLPAGRREYHNWSATIREEDHTRIVDGTNPEANCNIVMIGDSTTFGHGVNDGQTWVDVLGRHFSDVYIINAGISQYDHLNIARSIHAFPEADGYIYLLDDNDVTPGFAPVEPQEYSLPQRSMVVQYLYYFWQSYRGGLGREFRTDEENIAAYFETFEREFNRDNVLVIAFDWGSGLVKLLQERGYALTLIEPYKETVSIVDIHPSVRSSQQIGENLIPIVTAFKEEVCATGE